VGAREKISAGWAGARVSSLWSMINEPRTWRGRVACLRPLCAR
jgi:hypothetical protein